MNKEELLQKFIGAIPDMAKDVIWSTNPSNSLGFIKTRRGGTCEIVISLINDSDDWIIEEPTEENTLDLFNKEL
ncbi:hypothetical protein E2605_18690 [Dysgonomonas capnocytophagoides]|uniref:Uncharacterized protein n=1 Tax=Dysgonomonas capnocytophagoides TaxID=45254 RepID=A0A4Y8KTU6_9BACT|nr:hypothetical protein [Dysgonomonas capnocytophagoides]TFD92588.1 hypothetical protein E2605_18690 [Dysgonomonas capnocytophagoides]